MKALVVYESLFGNARAIADAVADGLRETCDVQVMSVAVAPTVLEDGLDLLVVGGPTHQFRMPRRASREEAARMSGLPVATGSQGLTEWLSSVQVMRRGVAGAAFATRLDRPRFLRWIGSAARATEGLLARLGCRIVLPAESFFVSAYMGPLLAGETERARSWGTALARALTASKPAPSPVRAVRGS